MLRERSEPLRARFNSNADLIPTSTIVLTELLHGAFRSARPEEGRKAVLAFVARMPMLDYDAAAAAHTADIRATLEKKGSPIGNYDLLIAGHARSRGLVVVTSDLGEFTRVDGLRVEDWNATGSPPA